MIEQIQQQYDLFKPNGDDGFIIQFPFLPVNVLRHPELPPIKVIHRNCHIGYLHLIKDYLHPLFCFIIRHCDYFDMKQTCSGIFHFHGVIYTYEVLDAIDTYTFSQYNSLYFKNHGTTIFGTFFLNSQKKYSLN